MRVVYSPRHHLPDPDFSFEAPGTFGIGPIRAVHDAGLIAYLETSRRSSARSLGSKRSGQRSSS